MKYVYIAGQYRAPTNTEIELNCQKAWQHGCRVARLGGFPVIPQVNTYHMDGIQDDAFWLKGTMGLLERSDCLYLTGDWQKSEGAMGELKRAMEKGMPVFTHITALKEYLEQNDG